MKISVVIPAHNEESNLGKISKLLLKNFNSLIYEIIIVDDCSTDQTAVLLNQLAKRFKKIKPIYRQGNKGVGRATREGLNAVSDKSDYVLMLDCDFIQNIPDIHNMIKLSPLSSGLLGSRYIKKGQLINYPIIKKIANRTFHILIRLLLGITQLDVTNNFKLYRKEVVEKIKPLLKSEGFSINAETGIYPLLLGYQLKEVPVFWIGRTKNMGFSHFNILKACPGYIKVLFQTFKFKYSKRAVIYDKSSEKFK